MLVKAIATGLSSTTLYISKFGENFAIGSIIKKFMR
jgi:hypothetical protein